MPSRSATRRASSTSATEQQPESLSPPHNFIVTPVTSCPASSRSAAATEESTPPDIAEHDLRSAGVLTRLATGVGRRRPGRPPARDRHPRRCSSVRAVRRTDPRMSASARPMATSTWESCWAPLGTRGCGRSVDTGLFEQEQQGLALDVRKPDMGVAGEAMVAASRIRPSRRVRARESSNPSSSRSRRPRTRATSVERCCDQGADGGAEPDDARRRCACRSAAPAPGRRRARRGEMATPDADRQARRRLVDRPNLWPLRRSGRPDAAADPRRRATAWPAPRRCGDGIGRQATHQARRRLRGVGRCRSRCWPPSPTRRTRRCRGHSPARRDR